MSIKRRFWDKVNKTDNIDNCWEWNAGSRGNGYGAIKYNKKVIDAHRLSWILQNGELNDSNIYVCHKCDNRKCVNPNHLFLGSHSDNIKDGYKKGRIKPPVNNFFKKGNTHATRLISNELALEIFNIINERRKNKEKLRLKELSNIYSIPYTTIRDISCGKGYINK